MAEHECFDNPVCTYVGDFYDDDGNHVLIYECPDGLRRYYAKTGQPYP